MPTGSWCSRGGRIVADGPFEALAARPPNLRAARALGLENLLPADLVNGGTGGWWFAPPGSVTVDPPGTASPPGSISLDGTVETVEEIGAVSRIRILVESPGDRVRIVGFAATGAPASCTGLPGHGAVPGRRNAAPSRLRGRPDRRPVAVTSPARRTSDPPGTCRIGHDSSDRSVLSRHDGHRIQTARTGAPGTDRNTACFRGRSASDSPSIPFEPRSTYTFIIQEF